MQHDAVKQYIDNCPDLICLDDVTREFLMWRGKEIRVEPGATLYAQGAPLDDTFCLLVTGELVVEVDGKQVGTILESQLFGEMAYFVPQQARMATIRAGALGALVLQIRLSGEELDSPDFASLKRYLGAQAWDTFVSDSRQTL